jgi:phage tail-like protein
MGDPALSIIYKCTVDGFIPLGIWTKIEGLGFEYDIYEYHEGGVNGFTQKRMGPVKYENLRLSRPVDSNSLLVSAWLKMQSVKVVPQTMAISALSTEGEEITTWNLAGVVPRKWTGPTLDIMGNAIATETLEVIYQEIIGFGGLGGAAAGALTAGPAVRNF